MVKKICSVLVLLIMVTLCSLSVFAGADDKVYDADTKATKELYVTITRPDGKTVITKNKSYTINARAKQDNVQIELYRLNEDKKEYEKIVIEDKSSWKIEKAKVSLSREISLKEGSNVIMLVAHGDSDDKDEQRSIFEIKYDKKSTWEEIKDSIEDAYNLFFDKN